MARLHHGASIVPSKPELIAAWLPRQRWYRATGKDPQVRRLASWRLDDPAGAVGIETIILADDASGPEPVVYQVPLTYRDAPLTGAEEALVGITEHSVLGTRWVYDAPHDPVYAEQLFALAQGLVPAASSSTNDAVDETITGTALAGFTVRVSSARVLTGEQSNTSIIAVATTADGTEQPVIGKVFRVLADGDNPDVLLQGALAAAGCTRVPASIGSVHGSWAHPSGSGTARGHLVFVQEFLPGAQDAWREALIAAGSGVDFTEGARALGAATAEVHDTLRQHQPTEPATPERIEETLAQMRGRLRAAIEAAPSLAARADEIDAALAMTTAVAWPHFQRIHGDFHLGQVLDVPGRGWVLLDFEGEPMRPLAERNRTDQPLRDVAGMLRSFDYAGGAVEHGKPGVSARAWVAAAQAAFLVGYAAQAGRDPAQDATLLAAYQLDKALYEVVYEARNRPTWLGIPIAAIDRLLSREGASKEDPR